MTIFNNFPINGVSISNLSPENSPALTDVIVLVHNGVTYNTTLQNLLALFMENTNYFSSTVMFADRISLTSNIAVNITSLPLPIGKWAVGGNISFSTTSMTDPANAFGWSNNFSVSLPDQSLYNQLIIPFGSGGVSSGFSIPERIYNLNAPTNIYLSAKSIFLSGSVQVCGNINAIQI